MTIKIEWKDAGLEPKVAPNPRFPDGIDVRLDERAKHHCTIKVPYPAKRIGVYMLECDACGMRVAVTTAGRPDDPRSVRMPCKRENSDT